MTMRFDIRDRTVDGGYGCVIVVAAFFIILTADGMLFSFGNLLIELIDHFNEDRATTAVIGSVLLGMACLTGPVWGIICNKYGCRVSAVIGAATTCTGFVISTFATSISYLYISYGLVGGVGLGSMYLSANVSVLQHFNKYRGFACGILLCGTGAGTFILNLFTRFLINTYGWRGAVLIEAGMSLQAMVFGVLLVPPLHEKEILLGQTDSKETEHLCSLDVISEDKPSTECPAKDKRTTNVAKCRGKTSAIQLLQKHCLTILAWDRILSIFLLSTFLIHLAFLVVIGFTVDLAVELGMSKYKASWLASSFGLANIASGIFFGWIADRKGVCRIVLVCVLLLLAGISTSLSLLLKTFVTRMIYTSLFGFFIGGYMSVCPLVLADLFSAEEVAKVFGLYMLSIGISSTIATPIGGFLFDRTKSYDVTFVIAGYELILGGVLTLCLKCMTKKTDSQEK